MPLPLIIGVGAAIAGLVGAGAGVKGGVEMYDANEKMKKAEARHKSNNERLEAKNKASSELLDSIGKTEMESLSSFSNFSDLIEKLQNRPDFKNIDKESNGIPNYTIEELKKVSVGAGLLLGGLTGAGLGVAGGFAAAGATTSAVMAFGAASTGTAISSLSGVAATNATLAALGGGSLAAGGGGMALGTVVLGGATLGVGLLVGGIIFSIAGSKLSKKADEAYSQMEKEEAEINRICDYLSSLKKTAIDFFDVLKKCKECYDQIFKQMEQIVYSHITLKGIVDWNNLSEEHKLIVEKTSICVGLLYNMCKVKLVKKADNKDGLNSVNSEEIYTCISNTNKALKDLGLVS